jgi:glycerophosphoryl diester phosphodiesterase
MELDAKLSADGEVVVLHDATVDRTTDGTGHVNSLTLPELKRLDAGSKYSSAFQSEKIPTLAEVFEMIGNQIIINVELTNYTSPIDDLPDRVVSLITKYGLESSVLISSYNILALIRARSLLPKIPLGLITFKGFANPVLHSKLVRLGPNLALHPNYEDVTPELIKAAQDANFRIHTYTVNQPDEMHRLFIARIDGIYTYDPMLAQNVLAGINS